MKKIKSLSAMTRILSLLLSFSLASQAAPAGNAAPAGITSPANILAPVAGTASFKCEYVAGLVNRYLASHLSINKFSTDISRRTLDNYLRSWDPGKMYFTQNDVDLFEKKFAETLPTMISKGDCSAIDLIYVVYGQRYGERAKVMDTLIDGKYDFTVDEYFVVDRKSRSYAKDERDMGDRWTKRIKYQLLQLRQVMKNPKEIITKLKKRYQLANRRQNEVTTEDVYGSFMKAFTQSLDPHSDYFSATELEEFRINTRLSLDGIGALLRSEDGVTSVQSLVPGGAAAKSGLIKVGDKIIAVGQKDGAPVDVIDMDLRDVVKLIRGPGGTLVRLTLRRLDKELKVAVTREKVQLADRAVTSEVYEMSSAAGEKVKNKTPTNFRVGVIDLPSFYIDFEARQAHNQNYRSSSRDMIAEIEKLKKAKVDVMVVDLRMNGGGALDEAVAIAGLFNGKGPVVQIKAAGEKPYVSDYSGPAVYDGPVLFLGDRQSASASEILLGAIQDTERGLIVGDPASFGKGTVQNLSDLDNNLGAIKVTISKFFRPSGASTQLKGVASDVVLPSLFDHFEVGERFYDYALPFEQIEAKPFVNFKMVRPYVEPIKAASSKRIAASAEFKKVQKYIDEYEKNKGERLRVSLQEKPKKKGEKDLAAVEEEEMTAKERSKDKLKRLKDDIYLQETLHIAADYVQRLQNQTKTPLTMRIVGLKN
jgi:carboxyl-terminal processing protease